jgi:hypothetical protein
MRATRIRKATAMIMATAPISAASPTIAQARPTGSDGRALASSSAAKPRMRRWKLLGATAVAAAALVATVTTIPAAPAQAEPCGASSWLSGSTQYVGYRNCGGGNSPRLRAHIGGDWGGCYIVPGYTSGILHSRTTNRMLSWGLSGC